MAFIFSILRNLLLCLVIFFSSISGAQETSLKDNLTPYNNQANVSIVNQAESSRQIVFSTLQTTLTTQITRVFQLSRTDNASASSFAYRVRDANPPYALIADGIATLTKRSLYNSVTFDQGDTHLDEFSLSLIHI